jgi:hypothetical protein
VKGSADLANWPSNDSAVFVAMRTALKAWDCSLSLLQCLFRGGGQLLSTHCEFMPLLLLQTCMTYTWAC